MSGYRWRQVERIRKALPQIKVSDRTPIEAAVVYRPESVIWTYTGDEELRAWHVSGDGSLHETPESVRWTLERATDRAVGRVAGEAS